MQPFREHCNRQKVRSKDHSQIDLKNKVLPENIRIPAREGLIGPLNWKSTVGHHN